MKKKMATKNPNTNFYCHTRKSNILFLEIFSDMGNQMSIDDEHSNYVEKWNLLLR